MKQSEKKYKKIVVKIGSSLLYFGKELDEQFLEQFTGQIAQLVKLGKDVVLVSSGAIASGMYVLKFNLRPKDISSLQALAAVGQHFLMSRYRYFFSKNNLECAQVLLTWDDFDSRRRYLNAKNTLLRLLELGTVPIINENDTVATDEIKFGDNDQLSARVANLVSADLLIILSDVDGLLDKDKKRIIRIIDKITPQIKDLACSTDKKTSVGGMITKIEAAKISTESGIPCVIANGLRRDILSSVIHRPHENGTLFVSQKTLQARERWIAFGTKPKGRIVVDEGAKNALLNNKSLLSVGVIGVEGAFVEGDIVSVQDLAGREFARGKTGVSSRQLEATKGRHYEKEIIHRDNIVIL